MSSQPVARLRQKIRGLEAEIRTLTGQLANRDPAPEAQLRAENEKLRLELERLDQDLRTRLSTAPQPRQPDAALKHAEFLRLAAVEYCRISKTDPELWKNIAF